MTLGLSARREHQRITNGGNNDPVATLSPAFAINASARLAGSARQARGAAARGSCGPPLRRPYRCNGGSVIDGGLVPSTSFALRISSSERS